MSCSPRRADGGYTKRGDGTTHVHRERLGIPAVLALQAFPDVELTAADIFA